MLFVILSEVPSQAARTTMQHQFKCPIQLQKKTKFLSPLTQATQPPTLPLALMTSCPHEYINQIIAIVSLVNVPLDEP
jgi:hypothetical protein